MKPTNAEIHLHIEELVLHGFAPADRHHIGAAVEQELSRLLAEQPPAPGKNISLEQVDSGAFQMKNAARPASIGGQIAGAIHGGIRL